jgi:2-(1,2-epoxy-1,2-dihydrophenyl)acetyl-CoA isomerase
MDYQDILYTKAGNVATITLNRPEKMNAFRRTTLEELADVFAVARNDEEVRVAVITGAGRGFCSGGDIAEDLLPPGEKDIASDAGLRGRQRRAYTALRELDKPTIAAINGAAVAEGFTLALLCDIRIAAEGAKLGDGGMRMAMPGDIGNLYLLPRIVGLEKALEMTYLGNLISAEEAHRLGIISRVVPAGELSRTAADLAAELAKRPPVSMRLAKAAIYRLQKIELGTAYEDLTIVRQVALETQDAAEGMRAFAEKRPAVFKGK